MDYRGLQNQTVDGRKCVEWNTEDHYFKSGSHPDRGLVMNYCRNPNYRPTIWCYTSKTSLKWQYCTPLKTCLKEIKKNELLSISQNQEYNVKNSYEWK
jgi:hypothetical protein